MENINLASSKLGTVICCNSVSNEEYPCQNLLEQGDKGFMAEYFIRPPVIITVHLPFPVVLARLSWNTTLGSQSCSLHEVSTSAGTAQAGDICSSSCRLPPDRFWQVGRGVGEGGTISFCNRRVGYQEGLRLGCRDNWEALNKVTAVRITILRTERNTVPCMSNLRIFGLSTREKQFAHLEQELIKKSEKLSQDNKYNFNFFGGEESEDAQVAHEVIEEEVTISDTDQSPDAPAEFLDSITHCLMLLPMTLPSGHHVDRSTLDKCKDSFAAWGGQPRDPFTGKLFTARVQPVFNAALKSRIDSFLLKGGRKAFASRGRTLGSAEKIQEFLTSKAIKRRLPGDEEDAGTSSNKVIIVESSSDSDEQDESSKTDLDKALFKTLSKVKPILK